jgi:hypothetical protein
MKEYEYELDKSTGEVVKKYVGMADNEFNWLQVFREVKFVPMLVQVWRVGARRFWQRSSRTKGRPPDPRLSPGVSPVVRHGWRGEARHLVAFWNSWRQLCIGILPLDAWGLPFVQPWRGLRLRSRRPRAPQHLCTGSKALSRAAMAMLPEGVCCVFRRSLRLPGEVGACSGAMFSGHSTRVKVVAHPLAVTMAARVNSGSYVSVLTGV